MAVTLSLDSDNNGKTVDVFIVSSSAPTCTSTHSEVEWEAYYDALSAALARRPPNAIVIIGLGADTNASIGRGKLSDNDNDIESSVVGCFGIERINDAGRRLRVFMDTHHIAALSTLFNKKYYSTCWTHPVSKCSYQIDHVFTFREDLRHFSDAGSVSGQLKLIDSDHRAVKASSRSLAPPKKKRRLKNERQKLMVMRLDYVRSSI